MGMSLKTAEGGAESPLVVMEVESLEEEEVALPLPLGLLRLVSISSWMGADLYRCKLRQRRIVGRHKLEKADSPLISNRQHHRRRTGALGPRSESGSGIERGITRSHGASFLFSSDLGQSLLGLLAARSLAVERVRELLPGL